MVDCISKSFADVSKLDNDVLPRSIVTQMIDKQSAAIALKFFSKEVEEKMVELEHLEELEKSKKPPEK